MMFQLVYTCVHLVYISNINYVTYCFSYLNGYIIVYVNYLTNYVILYITFHAVSLEAI